MLRQALLFLVVALCAFNTHAGMKSALLYVGPTASAAGSTSDIGASGKWVSWSAQDIADFSSHTNTFIILPTPDNGSTDYVSYQWDSYNHWFHSSITYYNFSRYLIDVRETVQAIAQARPDADIYISLPRYKHAEGHKYYSRSAIQAFLRDLKAQVEVRTSASYWNNNIKGYYVVEETYDGCVEDLPIYCLGGSERKAANDDFTYFKHARETINQHQSGKKLIWAPHFNNEPGVIDPDPEPGTGSGEYFKLSELLTWQKNNMLIFDTILMQPGQSRNWSCTNCLQLAAERVASQTISRVHAGQTRLGVVFELFPNPQTANDYWCSLRGLRNDGHDFTYYFGYAKGAVLSDSVGAFYSGTNDDPQQCPHLNPTASGSFGRVEVTSGSWTYYTVDVPAGTSELIVKMFGYSGDAELYTNYGSQPGYGNWQCASYNDGSNEACIHANPTPGTWHIAVQGSENRSDIRVDWSYK